MKWLPLALIVLIVAGVAAWQFNATKTSYVNGLPEYNKLPGKEYLLQRDVYLFADSTKTRDWPFIADNKLVPELPAKVDAALLGTPLKNLKLLEIAHVGDRVRLVSVRKYEGRRENFVTFELLFMDRDSRKYERVDAYWLMDHSAESQGKAPSFLPEYVVERVRN